MSADKRPRGLRSFKEAVEAELKDVDVSVDQGCSGEPRVTHANKSLVGLAFSGGGIRSATFNLGLLKALSRAGVLKDVDYLSTVSGGGYVGGWYKAWQRRREASEENDENEKKDFPKNGSGPESEEIRHLRERGQFLIPRMGIFSGDTALAVSTLYTSMLAALLVANLFMLGAVLLFRLAASFFFGPDEGGSVGLNLCGIAGLSALFTIYIEFWKNRYHSWEGVFYKWLRIVLGIGLPVVTAAFLLTVEKGIPHLGGVFDIEEDNLQWLVLPVAALLLAAVLVVPTRLLMFWDGVPQDHKDGYWRSTSLVIFRYMVLALGWAVASVCWVLGMKVENMMQVGVVGSLAMFSSGAFRWLMPWLAKTGRAESDPEKASVLRRLFPQILSYGTLAVALIFVSSLCMACPAISKYVKEPLSTDFYKGIGWAAFSLIVAVGLLRLLPPNGFGLHSFYRDRIVDAFIADPAKAKKGMRRVVTDDVPVSEMGTEKGPFHLVCCAANDLAGDGLETLDRGARSAVVSSNGLYVGGSYAGWKKGDNQPTVGSALTASAAAFNSNMGSISKQLGPAVTFLMSALNLRLGYWLRHPASITEKKRPGRVSGWCLISEFFSYTHAQVKENGEPYDDYVHLSDGGHFENLAIYELIRRRCRFIVASDAGADPDKTFNDFGNCARRVRTDFGVEIDIDLSELYADENGRSKNHVAVGMIKYDKGEYGILVYLKPTTTGDEEVDIVQYQKRNKKFPHESTGDQFYDEAQWESYYRLGEHVGQKVFGFLSLRPEAKESPEQWFNELLWRWKPTPKAELEARRDLEAKYSDFLSFLSEDENKPLLGEYVPELKEPKKRQSKGVSVEASYLAAVKAMEMMVASWRCFTLWKYFYHPDTRVWRNRIEQWCHAEAFTSWWPFLRPETEHQFQVFLEDKHPGLRSMRLDAEGTGGRLFLEKIPRSRIPGVVLGSRRSEKLYAASDYEKSLSFIAKMNYGTGGSLTKEVGFAEVEIMPEKHDEAGITVVYRWRPKDLFIAYGVRSAGLGSRMVDALLSVLQEQSQKGRRRKGKPIAMECMVDLRHVGGDHDEQEKRREGAASLYRPHGFVKHQEDNALHRSVELIQS